MKLSWWGAMLWLFCMFVLLIFGYAHDAKGADCEAMHERELYEAIQAARAAPLRIHPVLMQAARLKAVTLLTRSPDEWVDLHKMDGIYWPLWVRSLGYPMPVHESIVTPVLNAQHAMDSFKTSSPHWAHIVGPALGVMGFAVSCRSDGALNVVIYTGVE
jgi:hypothetical protein